MPIELAMRENCKNEAKEPQASPGASASPAKVEDLLRRVDVLPTLDPRSEDEILGYDDDGIPR